MTRQTKLQYALVLVTIVPRLVLFGRALANHFGADSGYMIYDGYLSIAQSLISHHVYGFDGVHSITTRAPLLPLLLIPGVVVHLPVIWTFLLQLILSVGAVLNTQAAARRFGASERASFVASAFLALDPWFMSLARYGSTTVTAVFLITCILRFLSSNRYGLLGLCGGLLALCHPSCALALPGALVADAIRRGWRGVAPRAVTAIAAYVIIISPWIVRNYMVAGRVIPGVDGFGYQYLLGSSALKFGKPVSTSLQPLLPPGHEKSLYATLDATANAKLDRIAMKELSDTLLHNPGRFVYRCARQFVSFWIADKRDQRRRSSVAHLLYLLPLFLGAVIALFSRWRSTGCLILISAPTIAIHSVVIAYAADAMYSLPAIPVLAVMTACVAEQAFHLLKKLSRRESSAPGQLSASAEPLVTT